MRPNPRSLEERGDADLVRYAMRLPPKVGDVGSRAHCGDLQRAAANGVAVRLAGTVFVDAESQVCSELRPVGEP